MSKVFFFGELKVYKMIKLLEIGKFLWIVVKKIVYLNKLIYKSISLFIIYFVK